nr:YadA-like family protein [Haemophilus haemolyticus]
MGTNSAAIKHNSIAIGHAAIAGGHTQADINALNAKKRSIEAHKVDADKRLLDKTAAAEANPTAENNFQLSAAKAAVERLALMIKRINDDIGRLSTDNSETTGAIAIGNQAKATNQNSTALGDSTRANIATGVALGSSSETTAAKGITGFSPTTQGTSDIRANTYKPLDGRVLTSTLGGVSVGSATNTRQINHVAAGTADDDAVNVAQLRSVNLKIAGNTNGETASAKAADMRNTATSKADVLLDSQTLNVVSSKTDLLTTDATNNTITITPKTTKVDVNNDKTKDDSGKATTPTTNGLVTATDLADTLNNMYWKIEADKNDKGDVGGKSTEAVKAGDKVRLIAGEGVRIDQSGRDFTFSVKKVVKEVDKNSDASRFFKAGDNIEVNVVGEGKDQHIEYGLNPNITINSVSTNGGAKLEGTALSGLSHHLVPDTPNPKVGTLPETANNQLNEAATVNDVLNAGWNLQNNGEAKDFVKPYDTVNFVDGKGTKAVVETTPNAATSNVKFDIDTGKITNNADGSVQGSVTPEMKKALDDAKKALADATTPEAKKAVQDKVDAAQANINNAGNQIATAQGVADTINKSGFTLTTSENGGKKLSGKDEIINPGKKVDLAAGKNMTVKQDPEGKVTYATADEVNFSSVQFGDNGPKITNNGGNINVGTATGAPIKITGVAPGKISADSTDAINGSQLYDVINNGVGSRINNLQGQVNKLGKRMNAGMATSAAMANLLQPHKPGQSVATAGVGQHKNQSAVAVGYSRISDNGKYGIRFSMGANTQGEVTSGAAVGYFW